MTCFSNPNDDHRSQVSSSFSPCVETTWIRPHHPHKVSIRINRAHAITVSNRKAQTARAFRARSRINEPRPGRRKRGNNTCLSKCARSHRGENRCWCPRRRDTVLYRSYERHKKLQLHYNKLAGSVRGARAARKRGERLRRVYTSPRV